MHQVKTLEPVSGGELAKQHHQRKTILESVQSFSHGGLKHSEVKEHNTLPDVQTLKVEKEHEIFIQGVQGFEHKG